MYLNAHSHFSLRYGTMSVPQLVEAAKMHGIDQLALTDINNSTGIMQFMRECNSKGIKPIAGMEFRRDKRLMYIGIAKNKEGMKELNDFMTYYNLHKKPLPDSAGAFHNVFVVYPYGHKAPLRENEFLGIRFDQLQRLYKKDLSPIKNKLVVLQPVFMVDK